MCFTRLYQIHGCTIKLGHYRVLSSLEMHNNMLYLFHWPNKGSEDDVMLLITAALIGTVYV